MRTSGGTMRHAMIMMQMRRAYGGAYSRQVMNDRLLGLVFASRVRWRMGSFARLLGNCNIGPSDLIRIGQARRDSRCGRRELAIIKVKFLDPIPVSEELWCFDELG